ncbi:MAG TPA: SDR family oxidoreductase [Methanomassiliicoccales archaeon]|nr:SDR family oxidoreductase [Methanomassiliicoccales archaeon]
MGNTVLITGGATGIGFELAKGLLERENEVIACCRGEEHLAEAKRKLPRLNVRRCDVSKQNERQELHDWCKANFPDLNILINNAGIQRMVDFRKGTEDLVRIRDVDGEDEIGINFEAYVWMGAMFVPDFLRRREAAIVNVSSGLAFIPLVITPVYDATKAAIHSFSITLRHQLRNTSIKVFEIIPPTVDTNLDAGARKARGQQDLGIPPEAVAEEALPRMEKDEYEIAIGRAENLRSASRTNFDQTFLGMNRSF